MLAKTKKARAISSALGLVLTIAAAGAARADDDVMLQGFYWDCPSGWYSKLEQKAPDLRKAGFTAIWLPQPAKAGAGGLDMGYDPYDPYDLGEFDQRGSVATHFGTKKELLDLVSTLHQNRIKAYADVVLNHMADGQPEWNPLANRTTNTKYVFAHPGPKMDLDYRDFHPSHTHPDQNAPFHDPAFGNDVCQTEGHMNAQLKQWGDWLVNTVGYDGVRLDYVKGIDPGFVKEWLSFGSIDGKFAVSECWDGDTGVLGDFVGSTGGRSSVFDFSLFYTLKSMCNDTSGGFDMRRLDGAGYAARDPFHAVTFVENHDTDRSDPVVSDKMMAYAFILTMEGYPCVFWKDYDNYGLKSKIDPLIAIRKRFCGGSSSTLSKDQHLFIVQRNATGSLPGCVLVINNDPTQWKGAWVTVKSEWANKDLKDWTGQAITKHVAADGRVQLWAPPRGYAVYALDGSGAISAAPTTSHHHKHGRAIFGSPRLVFSRD